MSKQQKEPTPKNTHRQKPQERHKEHLSESDLKSLMGINMPTYMRHKGAFRQK